MTRREEITREIMNAVERAERRRVRPHVIIRDLSRELGVDRSAIRQALTELVARRELQYAYRDPCSFVEKIDKTAV